MIEAKEKEPAVNKNGSDRIIDLALEVLELLQEKDLTFQDANQVLSVARDKLGDVEYKILKETIISSVSFR